MVRTLKNGGENISATPSIDLLNRRLGTSDDHNHMRLKEWISDIKAEILELDDYTANKNYLAGLDYGIGQE